jgi:hypothetical protein
VALCSLAPQAIPYSASVRVHSWSGVERLAPRASAEIVRANKDSGARDYKLVLALEDIPNDWIAYAESTVFQTGTDIGMMSLSKFSDGLLSRRIQNGALTVETPYIDENRFPAVDFIANGAFYMPLFGDARTVPSPPQTELAFVRGVLSMDRSTEVLPGVRCILLEPMQPSMLKCITPFAWPDGLLFRGTPGRRALSWPRPASPNRLLLDRYQHTFLQLPPPNDGSLLTYVKPMAFVYLRLRDLPVRETK